MDHFLVPNPSIGKLIGFSKLGKPGKCTKHETSETLFCLVLSLFFSDVPTKLWKWSPL